MTFLRNLASDLVDKKLWPVAVVLLAALVAVPVVLGRGTDSTTAPGPQQVALPPSNDATPVVQPAGPADSRERPGDVDNPIFSPPSEKSVTPSGGGNPFAAAADAPGAAGSSGGGGSAVPADITPTQIAGTGSGLSDSIDPGSTGSGSTGTGSAGSGSAGSGSTGSDSKDSSDKTKSSGASEDIYSVTMRFGEAGKMKTMRDVARLSPLPSADDPFIVFLGVSQDGKSAVYLVASDASVAGDGECKPSTTDCQTVALEAGDTEFFDLDLGAAGVRQYQLDLVGISRAKASEKAAAAARKRESADGRRLLRAAIASDEVNLDIDYSASRGTLVPAVPESQAKGGSTSTERAAQAADLVGGYAVGTRTGPEPRPRVEGDLVRLAPLPNADTAFVIFLGVMGDGETAIFANPYEAGSEGDGKCVPAPEACSIVELKAGERRVFDLDPGEGRIDYPVQVDTVTKRTVGSAIEAAAARSRESKAGRQFLRDGIKAGVLNLDGLEYDRAEGVLVRPGTAPAEGEVGEADLIPSGAHAKP